jgi:uncharacterized membrane protein (DUF485 family)
MTPMNADPSSKQQQIVADPEFQSLLKRKKSFILGATIFFLVYYFALLLLVGWMPDLMKKEVIGKVNLAYVFALSQFFMAWILAFVYVKKAAEWDKAVKRVLGE